MIIRAYEIIVSEDTIKNSANYPRDLRFLGKDLLRG